MWGISHYVNKGRTVSPPVHKSPPSELKTPANSSAPLALERSPCRSPTKHLIHMRYKNLDKEKLCDSIPRT